MNSKQRQKSKLPAEKRIPTMPRAFKSDWYDKQKLISISAINAKASEVKKGYDKYNLKYYDLKKLDEPMCRHKPDLTQSGTVKFKYDENGKQTLRIVKCIYAGGGCKATLTQDGSGWVSSDADKVDEKALIRSADPDDVKLIMEQLKQSYETLLKEYDMARNAMRAGLGDRPIKMRLTASFVITTTVTSGVTNTVTPSTLNPNTCGEWSALSGLFDEYKCVGGHLDFVYNNPISQYNTAKTSNNIPVIGYDADDGTALTSTLSGAQLAQHKTLTTTVSDGTTVAIPGMGLHHQFSWHVPKGSVPYISGIGDPGTNWIPVSGVSSAGNLKFYHVGIANTAVDTGAGICYFNLEFRCRS